MAVTVIEAKPILNAVRFRKVSANPIRASTTITSTEARVLEKIILIVEDFTRIVVEVRVREGIALNIVVIVVIIITTISVGKIRLRAKSQN